MGTDPVKVWKILSTLCGLFQVLYWYAEVLFRRFVLPKMKCIDREIILVTGATGGIGREICYRLAKSGTNMKLVLWDLNQTDLDKLAWELESSGSHGLKVYPFAIDISSKENIDDGCAQIREVVGNVSIIFNNAAIACKGNFLYLSSEQIQDTIDINLMSHLWIIRQFLPDMVAKNHGRIINVCCMSGLQASANVAPYSASKFGLNGFTEGLKAELIQQNYINRCDGVKVTTAYPYFVQTPMIGTLTLNPHSRIKLPFGFNKIFMPEDVAKKIVEGMRREYEYIYIPSITPLLYSLGYLIPLKLKRTILSKCGESFIFNDVKEHEKVFNSPYRACAPLSAIIVHKM